MCTRQSLLVIARTIALFVAFVVSQLSDVMGKDAETRSRRRPGRPPSYVFDKPDHELTDLERRLKLSVIKRRQRQNRSYHRRKHRTGIAVVKTRNGGENHPPGSVEVIPAFDSVCSTDTFDAPKRSDETQLVHDFAHAKEDTVPSFLHAISMSGSTSRDPIAKQLEPSSAEPLDHRQTLKFDTGREQHRSRKSISSDKSSGGDASFEDLVRSLQSQVPDESCFASSEHFQMPAPNELARAVTRRDVQTVFPAPFSSAHRAAAIPDLPQAQNPDSESLGSLVADGVTAYEDFEISQTASRCDSNLADRHELDCLLPHSSFRSCPATELMSTHQNDLMTSDSILLSSTDGTAQVSSAEDGLDVDCTVQSDEELLRDELLNIETSASVASSAAVMRLGASAVESVLVSMSTEAKVAAKALAVFPDSFDACAAAAMLGTNVTALQDLMKVNVLFACNFSNGRPRFVLNPLVRHILPAIRLHRKSASPEQNGSYFHRKNVPLCLPDFDESDSAISTSGDSLPTDLFGQGDVHDDPDMASTSFPYDVDDELGPSEVELHARFVAYFGKLMSSLSDNPAINRNGQERLRAMRTFDVERRNLFHALKLSENLGQKIHVDFLRKGAVVMRYCTDAKCRVSLFKHALDLEPCNIASMKVASVLGDDSLAALSAHSTPKPESKMSEHSDVGIESEPIKLSDTSVENLDPMATPFMLALSEELCPELAARTLEEGENSLKDALEDCTWLRNVARIHLALGEAYFDMLDVSKAEEPLENARALLDARGRRSDCRIESISLALPNLLLAEIRASRGETNEAKKLLHYALSLLSQAGLGESTFTVSAMNTLVGVLLSTRCYEDAMRTSTQMVDVLNNMGYHNMPIYADALGTLATVHLHIGRLGEAEKYFCDALEVIEIWLGKSDWHKSVPYEHCQDLDIWLLEGLAWACHEQGKIVQAEERHAEAEERRQKRGLASADTKVHDNGPKLSMGDHVDVLAELSALLASPNIVEALQQKRNFPARMDRKPYSRHVY